MWQFSEGFWPVANDDNSWNSENADDLIVIHHRVCSFSSWSARSTAVSIKKQPPWLKLNFGAKAATTVEEKHNSRSTWNPRNKSIHLKQQESLTRTLLTWQPPVREQRKRLKAVEHLWHRFSFWDKVKLNDNQKWPSLFSSKEFGTFLYTVLTRILPAGSEIIIIIQQLIDCQSDQTESSTRPIS